MPRPLRDLYRDSLGMSGYQLFVETGLLLAPCEEAQTWLRVLSNLIDMRNGRALLGQSAA
jgi:hypothetical protein